MQILNWFKQSFVLQPMPQKDWNGYGFHYKVLYKEKNSEVDDWKLKNVTEPTADHVSIADDIQGPYKEYQVKVYAQNELGESATVPKTVDGHSGEGGMLNFKAILELIILIR